MCRASGLGLGEVLDNLRARHPDNSNTLKPVLKRPRTRSLVELQENPQTQNPAPLTPQHPSPTPPNPQNSKTVAERYNHQNPQTLVEPW